VTQSEVGEPIALGRSGGVSARAGHDLAIGIAFFGVVWLLNGVIGILALWLLGVLSADAHDAELLAGQALRRIGD
jgi:hypothetical protein